MSLEALLRQLLAGLIGELPHSRARWQVAMEAT
jgi:hypothetical protein